MLESRPRLKNHLLALATVGGIMLAGAAGVDFLLTGGVQWGVSSAQADDQPVVVYAGDTDVYWEQPTAPPPNMNAGYYEIGYTTGESEEDLDGGTHGDRVVHRSTDEDALYREIEALYAQRDAERDVAALEDGTTDVYEEQLEAQAQALGDYGALKPQPSDSASPS